MATHDTSAHPKHVMGDMTTGMANGPVPNSSDQDFPQVHPKSSQYIPDCMDKDGRDNLGSAGC